MEQNNFLKRVFAYFLDLLIVGVVLGTLTTFFVPQSKNSKKLSLEQENITSSFFDKELGAKEFANRSIEIGYDQAKEEIPVVIIDIAGMLLYFVVFQAYNKGQTIGKKLVKLKVVGNSGKELGLNDYLKRVLIIPPIFCDLLDLILLMFVQKNIYLTSNIVLTVLKNLLLLITGIMVIYRKDNRGLHDLIADTKVIELKEKKKPKKKEKKDGKSI